MKELKSVTMNKPEKILKKVFGYNYFRPLQKEIIYNVLNRVDTLAIMPTGGGKSLCYQIPALIFEGEPAESRQYCGIAHGCSQPGL